MVKDGYISGVSLCGRALVVKSWRGVFVCAAASFTPSFQLIIQRYWLWNEADAQLLLSTLDDEEVRRVLRVVPHESVGSGSLPQDSGRNLRERTVQRLIKNDIKLYHFDERDYSELNHPQATLLVDMRRTTAVTAWDAPNASIQDIREAITSELSVLLAQRGMTKDVWDRTLREEPWYNAMAIYAGAATAGVGDFVKGIADTAAFVLEVAYTVSKVPMKVVGTALNVSEKLLNGKIDDIKRMASELGSDIVKGVAQARELIEKGAHALKILFNDPSIGMMLAQYLWAHGVATPRTETLRSALSVAADVLITLGLAVVTGGVGGAAYLARMFGAFSGRLIQLLSRAFKALTKAASTAADAAEEARLLRRAERAAKEAAESKGPVGGKNSGAESKAGPKADDQKPGTNKNGDVCSADKRTCTGGEPISLVTGEEILVLTDFALSGVMPLAWERRYKSSNPDDMGLGHGWMHSFSDWLDIGDAKTISYHTAEARVIEFARPGPGNSITNRIEKLRLHCIDSNRFVIASTDSPSLQRIFTRTANQALLTEMRDGSGNALVLAYDDQQLRCLTASHGVRYTLSYDKSGHIDAVRCERPDGASRVLVRYRHDANNDLISAIDAAGQAEHYTYRNHLIASRALKSGYRFHFEWDRDDSNARCLRNWGDPIDGQPTYDYRFAWDRANRSVAVTDTRGGTECYRFNPIGLPLYRRDQEGGETHYQYDVDGNLVRLVDPLGHEQRFSYDSHGRLRQAIDAEGAPTRLHRDANGNIVEILDPLGQRWLRRYNDQGQLTEQINPLGESTRYQYNALGLISGITNPLGERWQYLWDNAGQLSAVRNPLGHHTRYQYNDNGQITAIIAPDGHRTEYDYDAGGRCSIIKTPDGQTRQFEYNPLGLLSEQRDGSGRVTHYHYNGLSQVIKRVDPLGHTLHYHYDGERNLIGLTNENGERYSLIYDRCERLIEETGFDGRTQRYRYNAAGHLIAAETLAEATSTHHDRRVINHLRYERNKRGQLLTQWSDPHRDGDIAAPIATLQYDKAGRLIGADNAHRKLQWRYDTVGRLIEDRQDDHILHHIHDEAGRRIGTQLPNGDRIAYRFDATGAFAGLSFNDQAVAAITRDDLGREIERQHANQLVTEQQYDPQGRLQRQALYGRDSRQNLGRPVVTARDYHYNALGQLSQIDDQRRGTTQYLYDPLDRLTQVAGPNPETFVHDPAGNILATGETTAAPGSPSEGNRLRFYGDCHYSYDAHGNRIEQRRGKDGKQISRYEYDALNQLTAIENSGQRTEYAYDALGRRIRKQNGQSTTEFLWLDDVLLSESTERNDKTQATTSAKIYLFEPGTFKPLAFVENQQLYHYHLDHLGTPQEITDARGRIVWGVSYRAYGSVALAHEQIVENNLRFQGQYFDEESGLHYNRFRYYDPETGRFINQDPIGPLGGTNNYRYVPNPISWIDPFGLSCKEIPENYDPLTDSYKGAHGFRIPDGDPNEALTIYRGVHPTHPDYLNALKGEAVPWGGHRDALAHNLGNNQSDFTSWTTNRSIAERFATSNPNAVLLEQQVVRNELIWSPDNYLEYEVLRLGNISGAKVTKP